MPLPTRSPQAGRLHKSPIHRRAASSHECSSQLFGIDLHATARRSASSGRTPIRELCRLPTPHTSDRQDAESEGDNPAPTVRNGSRPHAGHRLFLVLSQALPDWDSTSSLQPLKYERRAQRIIPPKGNNNTHLHCRVSSKSLSDKLQVVDRRWCRRQTEVCRTITP